MEEIMKLKEMLPDMEPAEISILMKKLLDLSDAVQRSFCLMRRLPRSKKTVSLTVTSLSS